jgi:hypothetical protein
LRIILTMAAAFLALPIAAAAQEPVPENWSQRLQAACTAIDRVDFDKLPLAGELPAADYHEEARRGRPGPGADALRVIRIVIRDSGPAPMPRDSIWAWQGPDRAWHVSRARHSTDRYGPRRVPWAHDTLDLGDLPASDWELTEGRLSAEAARDLETLLASDCFQREPIVRPLSLPERGGPDRDCQWHPRAVRMELIESDRTRRLAHLCNSYQGDGDWSPLFWVSDLVVDLLMRAPVTPSGEAARPQEVAAIPEAFRGRWGQDYEGCPGPHLDIAENGFIYEGRLHNRLRRATLRSPRTIIVAGDGQGVLHDSPTQEFELPLMLSPDLERLAVPIFKYATALFVLRRCR